MRRWLPLALLIVVAGAIVLAFVQNSGRKDIVAGTPSRASATQSRLEVNEVELAAQPDSKEHRESADPTGSATPVETVSSAQLADPALPTAHVKVSVIGKSKRQPIAGASVGIWPELDKEQESDADLHRRLAALMNVTQEEMRKRITGPNGEVLIALPSGLDVDLGATVEDHTVGTAMLRVPRLEPGEQREVVIEMPDSNDTHVFGKVVAEGSGAPLRDARVTLLASNPTFMGGESRWDPTVLDSRTTAADGVFEFDYPAWREPHLRIEASGYGTRLSEPLKECLDASRPLLIELARSGALHAHVLDSGGRACDALWIDLAVEGTSLLLDEQQNRSDLRADFPDEKWRAKTGPDGWVTINELPAEVPIEIYLHMGGRITRPSGNGLKLAPGETREVEWRMGLGCTLAGLVLDDDGKPVSGIRLWLTQAWSGSAPYFRSDARFVLEQTGRTDNAGRFEFVGVPTGEWFLGPAPDENWDIVPAGPESIAPVPERVVIGSERNKEITVHVNRGLFVSGHVVDPDGKPCDQLQISVDDDLHQPMLIGDTDEQGQFKVGPLRKQVVFLSARGNDSFMGSEPVRANAGDSGVQLVLRRGGKIRGRVIDAASGAGCAASLRFTLEVSSAKPSDGWEVAGTDENGVFDCFPRTGGSYSIAALTDDGRFAVVHGIGVAIGAVHSDVLLELRAGGSLHLSYKGAKSSLFARVRLDGADIKDVTIEAGRPITTRAPAGKLAIELRSEFDGPARTKAVELKPGETKEIVLTDEDR